MSTTNDQPRPDDLLSMSEAARIIGISKDALRTRAMNGFVQSQHAGGYRVIRRDEAERHAHLQRLQPGRRAS